MATIYLGPPLPVGLVRPTRDETDGPSCPCLALLPVGFAEPPRSPAALVVSYTTVSPLPVPEGHRRSALCCTIRRVSPPGRYPAPCPVESGLSSMPKHRGRPANSRSGWGCGAHPVKSGFGPPNTGSHASGGRVRAYRRTHSFDPIVGQQTPEGAHHQRDDPTGRQSHQGWIAGGGE